MKTAFKPATSPEEEEIDHLLGDQLLFDLDEPQKRGGPSEQVIRRAERAGLIELLRTGGRTKLTRATMKLIMMEGLPRIPFFYGKQGVAAAQKLPGKGKRA